MGKGLGSDRLLDTSAVSTGTGAGTLAGERAQLQAGIHGDHLGQNLQHILGNGLVVYRDQVLRLGVHLQSLVEAQSSLDVV